MKTINNWERIAILPLDDAKQMVEEIERELEIAAQLGYNEQTCRRGCSVTAEVLVKSEELGQVAEYLQRKSYENTEGQIAPEQLDSLYNPNEENAICPACGTLFKTSFTECPDCGLNFG